MLPRKPTKHSANSNVSHDLTSVPTALTGCYLDICRGKTHFPVRPINRQTFLIGSGEQCDLQLGGEGMPILHSVIHVDGQEIWLDAVAPNPPLLVNGNPERLVTLCDGDVIEVGKFQFRVRRSGNIPSAVGLSSTKPATPAIPEISPDLPDSGLSALEYLTAVELVDLIEAEQREVDEYENRRKMGVESLLGQLQQLKGQTATEQPEQQPTVPAPVPHDVTAGPDEDDEFLLKEMEGVLKLLANYSEELERRNDNLSKREAKYAEAASTLLDIQHTLAEQLEQLMQHIKEQAAGDQKQSGTHDTRVA